jgi:hypothetical protein
MASSTRLKFNMRGFRELRTSPGVRADLRERAARVAAAAGEGVEVLPEEEPRNRAHLVVAPVTPAAAARVASDNVLIRALEAGRD